MNNEQLISNPTLCHCEWSASETKQSRSSR